MKILFISKYGEGSDIALRMSFDDEVKLYIENQGSKNVYDGIMEKVPSWQNHVQWSDIIVFDSNQLEHIWEAVHKVKPTFGGSKIGNKLEKDRKFAHRLMNDVGMDRLESVSFKTINEAILHLKSHKVKHVIKPIGKDISSDDIITGEMKSGEDTAAMLEKLGDSKLAFESIEVEERKEGIEVGVSGWFNSREWIGDINVNFEHKRIASGEIGFNTGEMGTASVYFKKETSILFSKSLDLFKEFLSENDYTGQIDLNMIVNEEGIWPLEFTPRLGYPSIFIEDELQITPWAELFSAVAKRENFNNQTFGDWGIGVVVVQKGFPFEKVVRNGKTMDILKGVPIIGLSSDNMDHIHLYEALKSNRGIETTGGIGYPLVVTGKGETIEDSRSEAYKFLDPEGDSPIIIYNSYFRNDIGIKIEERLSEIKSLGILA